MNQNANHADHLFVIDDSELDATLAAWPAGNSHHTSLRPIETTVATHLTTLNCGTGHSSSLVAALAGGSSSEFNFATAGAAPDVNFINAVNFDPWANGNAQANLDHVKANQGTAPQVGPSLTSSIVAIFTGGITFDLMFDAAAMAAPASFRAGVEQAATLLANTISDRITVNLNIDCSGTGGGAAAGPDNGYYESYSLVHSMLASGAAPGDTTFNALPSGSSIQGQTNVAVWNAQMKVFGLLGANDTTTDDGSAYFATDINSSLLVGVALHELTHALGRVPFGVAPDIFDLFRFTSPSVRLFDGNNSAPASYFSLDGGITKLADFGQNSDPSDFLNSGIQGANDPFNEYYSGNTSQTLSSADLTLLHALGFHIGTVTTSAKPDLTVAGLNLTGTTVNFALNNVGTVQAAASTTSLYLSAHSIPTTSDMLVGTFLAPILQAGSTQNESIALSLPSNLAAGTYHLGVIADSTSLISEINESNNLSAVIPVIVGDANANSISGSNAIMFGMAGNDTIRSNGGNNVMVGGAGNDALIGGSGNDQFVFNTPREGLDQIRNFHVGDHIDFVAAGFGNSLAAGVVATGVLDPSHFIANSTGPTTMAQEFWFNTSNHTLYFNNLGLTPGSQEIAMAHLQNGYVLHSTDILLV